MMTPNPSASEEASAAASEEAAVERPEPVVVTSNVGAPTAAIFSAPPPVLSQVAGPPPPTVRPLELPPIPNPSGKVDPDVFNAWKKHMVAGYAQNEQMFSQVLDAFMRPYWLTVWMYRTMFAIGILGFLLAAGLSVWKGVMFGVLFGGLSVIAFLTFFVSQPLRSLEQNLQFITWLGVIYNTYWTRLMYANDAVKAQVDLEAINKAALADIMQLVDKHAELAGKRPGLPTEEQAPAKAPGSAPVK